jgi:voltage-gated potassium channel
MVNKRQGIMDSRTRLRASVILILTVISIGTAGYSLIEGWSFFDSLYMTVITITTIGFEEVHRMSEAGRIFTVVLIIFSVGAVFYALNSAARAIIEGELADVFGKRRLWKMISKMKDHYIICGYGRMGRIISKELKDRNLPFVIIEKQPDEDIGKASDYPVLYGDATKDQMLEEAGIERAKGLITVLPSDAENLYVVLSARGLNQTLNIVARAGEDGSEQKLLRAGASRVVSPYHIGALRIAHTLIKPTVVDFIEFTTQSGTQGQVGLELEEILVGEDSDVSGKSLSDCGIDRDLGLIVIAIKKPDGELVVSPPHDTVMSTGDILVVLGNEGKLAVLEKMAGMSERAF